ncbi:MAG: hypothetical protein WCY57_06390, partial [Micavibrio sp.]
QDPLRINPAPLRPRPAPVRAQAVQPFDGDAFLDAAILGEGAPAMARPAASGLTINPYPLQSSTAATTHADAEMNMQIERGMMEANGQLRPVAVPGKRMSGLERAQQAAAEAAAFDPASYDAQDGEIVEMTIAPPPRKPSIPQIAARAPSGRPAAHQQTASSSPAPVRAAPAQMQSYPEAVGFGRDLPLALALRQIVPAEYNYSFAQNIDLGANVSWEGGKPWNEVLQDMLSGTGFYADIRGNEVRIRNMNS